MTRRRRRLTSRGSLAHGAHGLAAHRRPPGAAPALRGGCRGAPRLLPGAVQVGGRWDAMGRLEKGFTGGTGKGVSLGARAAPALRGSAAPGLGSAGPAARAVGRPFRKGSGRGCPGEAAAVSPGVRPRLVHGGGAAGLGARRAGWGAGAPRDLSAWISADTGNLRARG